MIGSITNRMWMRFPWLLIIRKNSIFAPILSLWLKSLFFPRKLRLHNLPRRTRTNMWNAEYYDSTMLKIETTRTNYRNQEIQVYDSLSWSSWCYFDEGPTWMERTASVQLLLLNTRSVTWLSHRIPLPFLRSNAQTLELMCVCKGTIT